MNVLASKIGTNARIPNWPSNDLDGLFDALKRWPLDQRMNYSEEPGYSGLPGSAPFRGLAWGHCVGHFDQKLQKRVYRGTKPIYPDSPNAVRYCGNFLGYSFGFWLDTDDEALIAKLDHAIAENLMKQA